MGNNLKTELHLLNQLGFEELKPLVWMKTEENKGTLYMDYRQNNKRNSYAISFYGDKLDKTQFEAYILFKNCLSRHEKKSKPLYDEFTLSQEIDDLLQDCREKQNKSTIENRAEVILNEVKKRYMQ